MLLIRVFVGPRLVSATTAETQTEAKLAGKRIERRWQRMAQSIGQEMRVEITTPPWLRFPVGTPLREMRERIIAETVKAVEGSSALAAEVLGCSRRTVDNVLSRQAEVA